MYRERFSLTHLSPIFSNMNASIIALRTSACLLFIFLGVYASSRRDKNIIESSSSSNLFASIVKKPDLYSRKVQEIQNQVGDSCLESNVYNKISCSRLSCNGDVSFIYFRVLNRSCSNSKNDQRDEFKCYDKKPIVFPVNLKMYSKGKKKSMKGKGESRINILYDGLIQSPRQVISLTPSSSKVYVELYDAQSGTMVQEVHFYADCSKPLSLKDTYGALQVVEIKDTSQHVSCCMLPTPFPSTEPSSEPTFIPSQLPTSKPSNDPSSSPSFLPSILPTSSPSDVPSSFPTCFGTTCVQNPDHIVFEVKPFVSCEEAMNPSNKSVALVSCIDIVSPTFPLQLHISPIHKSSKSEKFGSYVTFDVERVGQKFVLEGDSFRNMPMKLQLQFLDGSSKKSSIMYQTLVLDSSCYENRAFSIGDRFGLLEVIGFSNEVQGMVGCF